jgi:hypothetical protein
MTTATARDLEASSGTGSRIRLPLLARLFDERDASARSCWADLGPVQPGLVAGLAGTRSKLFVLDLPGLRADGRSWSRPPAPDEPISLALCWDLLNYMDAGELGALSAAVAATGCPGCRMHALIQYSSKTMPGRPCAFSIDERLNFTPRDGGDAVEAPRYSPKALEKAMPLLRVESTMLLNNGMQEFVFAIREH